MKCKENILVKHVVTHWEFENISIGGWFLDLFQQEKIVMDTLTYFHSIFR